MIFKKCSIENDLINLINEDRSSEKKRIAQKSEKYYEARHDIKDYQLYYFNGDGELVKDEARSNIKISHAFYTELIDQKTSYLLSDFSITSKNEFLNKELKSYFDDDFKSELAELEENTSKIGFGYMYARLDKDFKTKFNFADGLGVIEVINESTEQLDYVVYYYVDRIEKAKKKVIRVEAHDKEQTFYYIIKDGKLEKDLKKTINPRPHKTWKEITEEETKIYGDGLGYIPFFRLDNNRKQFSDLKPIKELIDDYDLMSCGLSNNLQDISEGIYVIKGFQGDNLTELQHNIKTKKVIGVGDNGDFDIKTIDIPYEARKIKLELDEKNIYRFGMGFNSAQVGDGNITNVVIKSRYALLDLKCDKAERRLRSFLKSLINIVIDEINTMNNTTYSVKDITVNLNREVMTNASDNAQIAKTEAETKQIEVNTILNIASKLPEEKTIKLLCQTLDIDYSEIEPEVKEIIQSKKTDLNELSEKLLIDEISQGS